MKDQGYEPPLGSVMAEKAAIEHKEYAMGTLVPKDWSFSLSLWKARCEGERLMSDKLAARAFEYAFNSQIAEQ